MKRLAPSLVLLAALLPGLAPDVQARASIDDALLLRAAQGRALPRKLSPPREAALNRVVDHFLRGEIDSGLAVFEGFARGYFRASTGDDLEPVVLNLLRRGFLEPRPRLLDLAERAAWLDDRALVIERHLEQLDEALASKRKGYLPPVAGLELGPLEPNPFGEPYRWLPGRSMRKEDIRRELRSWEKKRLMTQEDAISAHLRLQGAMQAERDAVRTLSRVALALLSSGERALETGRP
jgi:hypothetical protein